MMRLRKWMCFGSGHHESFGRMVVHFCRCKDWYECGRQWAMEIAECL